MRLRIRGFRRFRVISLAVPDATGHFITWTNSDGTDACAQLDRVRGATIEIFEHAVISAHRCHVLFSESSVEPAAAGAERIPQARHAWPGSMGL
jgi:hypothetical protein